MYIILSYIIHTRRAHTRLNLQGHTNGGMFAHAVDFFEVQR